MATSEVKFMAKYKTNWGTQLEFEDYNKSEGGVVLTIDEDFEVYFKDKEEVDLFIRTLQAFSNGVTLDKVSPVPDDKHVTFPEDE